MTARAEAGGAWFWRDVVGPFAASRLVLLLAAWFSRAFPRDALYPDAASVARGWSFVPWRALDVWGRWDTSYYLDIAQRGYGADSAHLAFFPLYPALVRLVASLTGATPSRTALYLAAVAVSNVAALAGLAVLHHLAREVLHEREDAARTVTYLVAFPAGMFLSCAYTEGVFLLLGAATFLLGWRRRWALAGVTGFLLALTRPVGVLYLVPLAWLALRPPEPGRPSRGNIAWLALLPAGLAAYAAYGGWLTGDPLAVFHVQSRWGRGLSWPWTTLARPRGFHPLMTRIDAASAILFAGLGLAALRAARTRSLGLLLLLSVAPILSSGTLMSGTRFLAVAFPAFLLLAPVGRRYPLFDRAYLFGAVALQALFMAAWSQFGWLG